jgi:hypothetical protein
MNFCTPAKIGKYGGVQPVSNILLGSQRQVICKWCSGKFFFFIAGKKGNADKGQQTKTNRVKNAHRRFFFVHGYKLKT